jgi:hypothetical protein
MSGRAAFLDHGQRHGRAQAVRDQLLRDRLAGGDAHVDHQRAADAGKARPVLVG